MPRNARKDVFSKFFHIMVQGINKEYIFKEETEIKTFLKYLKERAQESNLQIISYCIMNNHAHILIHTNNIEEISKLMSRVNTKYAMFYNKKHNRCGVVFRNRYKSEQILTYSHLMSCINYIHNNPVKAKMCNKKSEYKYSSYNEYKKESILLNIKEIEKILNTYGITIEQILAEKFETYNFIETTNMEDKEEIKRNILQNFLEKHNINSLNDILCNKKYLKELINIMYIEYNFTQKEIAEIFGVNRLKIHRLIHEN